MLQSPEVCLLRQLIIIYLGQNKASTVHAVQMTECKVSNGAEAAYLLVKGLSRHLSLSRLTLCLPLLPFLLLVYPPVITHITSASISAM